jgi:hypothetical protein
MPTFTTETTLPASPAATFAFIVDLTKWPLFTGYGPLPGIVEASVDGGVLLPRAVERHNAAAARA